MTNNVLHVEGEIIKLTSADFEKLFDDNLSDYVKGKIEQYNFSYLNITASERDVCIRKIVSILLDTNLVAAGEQRLEQWESGWMENLEELVHSVDPESVIPRYYGKYDIVRLNQKFIRPVSEKFEYYMLSMILDWVFDKYLRDAGFIYEFGCGTGHHLFRVRKVNPFANLWGLDWTTASQNIIRKIALEGIDSKMFAHRFDFFNPDMDFVLEKDAVVYTVAALEQTGSRFDKFIVFLQKNKPRLCIHVEPISELLDKDNLLDYLSIEYFKKRNYLSGLLDYLRVLEGRHEIEILNAQRTHIGSFLIEGYSVVVWKPL